MFTTPRQSPWRSSLLWSTEEQCSKNQRFPKLLLQDTAQISLLPGSVPSPPPGISLFKPPSIRELITLSSRHWFSRNCSPPGQVFLLHPGLGLSIALRKKEEETKTYKNFKRKKGFQAIS